MTWLIDLDNTLHDANYAVFPAMHRQMNAYMAEVLGAEGVPANADTVNAVRLHYWKKYGATLLGLIAHHQVDAADFLQKTHQFPNFDAMLRFESHLRRHLKRLSGRKVLLTNAPHDYAKKVVRRLRLHRFFDQHIAIENMRVHGKIRPKPSRLLIRKILSKNKLSPSSCFLIEDTLSNLKAAKQLGVRTGLITQYRPDSVQRRYGKSPYVDIKMHSIIDLPARWR